MPGRNRIPSFQLASGTTDERDGSYNLTTLTTLGSIFYNTDTSNVEVYHEDPSNTVGWRDLVMNNKEQIDISGKLVVDGDVSFNAHLSAVDASFQNNVDISGKLVVNDDVSFNAHISAVDASFQNDVDISGSLMVNDDVSFNAHISAVDASFQNDVDISGNITTNNQLTINRAGNSLTFLRFNAVRSNGSARAMTISAPINVEGGDDPFTFATGNSYLFKTDNRDALKINSNGTLTSHDNQLTSDDRIKENEKLIVNATETLSKLTPQIYDKYRTMDLSGSFRVESGLIAQEVYYNAPELRHLVVVGMEKDASGNDITPTPGEMDLSGVDIANDPDYGSHGWSKTQHSSLNYYGLIAYLIKSNQELAERIETLKTENTEQKTENTEQKAQIIELTTDISMIRNHIGI